jgi:hypothetical protein
MTYIACIKDTVVRIYASERPLGVKYVSALVYSDFTATDDLFTVVADALAGARPECQLSVTRDAAQQAIVLVFTVDAYIFKKTATFALRPATGTTTGHPAVPQQGTIEMAQAAEIRRLRAEVDELRSYLPQFRLWAEFMPFRCRSGIVFQRVESARIGRRTVTMYSSIWEQEEFACKYDEVDDSSAVAILRAINPSILTLEEGVGEKIINFAQGGLSGSNGLNGINGINRMTNLTEVRIRGADIRLVGAIAQLPSLRTLTLFCSNIVDIECLRTSGVRTIHLRAANAAWAEVFEGRQPQVKIHIE